MIVLDATLGQHRELPREKRHVQAKIAAMVHLVSTRTPKNGVSPMTRKPVTCMSGALLGPALILG